MLLCAKYIVPITAEPIKYGAILVRGGKIRDIGDAEMLRMRYPEEETYDYGLAALLPGFVDAHTHMEGTALRGLLRDVPYVPWVMGIHKVNERLSHAEFYDSAVVGCLEAVAAGITTIADFSSCGAVVDAVQDTGLRAVVHREVSAMDKRRVDRAMKNAISDIEKWVGKVENSRVYVGIAPGALHVCHPVVYTRCAEYAGNSLRVAMHLAGSREEFSFVKRGSSAFSVDEMAESRGFVEVPPWLPTGVSPVQYVLNWGAFDAEKTMAVHLCHVDDYDIAQLKRCGVAAVFSPRAEAQLGMGISPITKFKKQGFRVGLGTDSPSVTDAIDMLAETRTGMLFQRATNKDAFTPASDMLEMATLGGARALHLDHLIGSLEVGKYADIIAVDVSSSRQTASVDVVSALVNSTTGSDVLMNMVCGKILYNKGEFNVNVDATQCVENVQIIRKKLCK